MSLQGAVAPCYEAIKTIHGKKKSEMMRDEFPKKCQRTPVGLKTQSV